MEQPGVVAGNFALSFSLNFLSFFVHISGSIRPITLIWASLERSFPPAEVEYRWCQIWSKMMTSEVEERPRFVTGGYGRHRRQWVKQILYWPSLFSQDGYWPCSSFASLWTSTSHLVSHIPVYLNELCPLSSCITCVTIQNAACICTLAFIWFVIYVITSKITQQKLITNRKKMNESLSWPSTII